MCQTPYSDIDDMDEISSTSSTQSHKKTGKLIEPRKIRKPLMEKKRRARINQSLDELKRIVVDAEKLAGQDLSRVNKLEKADILEMTVRYLKRKTSVAHPQLQSTQPPPSRPDVYLAGYKQCVQQVQDLLAEQWTDERRQQSGRRMVEHLEACVQRLDALPRRPPAPKDRLSSTSSCSDESTILGTAAAPACSASCSSSEDDDTVDDEQSAAAAMVRPARDNNPGGGHHHTTRFQDCTIPKSMWRPW